MSAPACTAGGEIYRSRVMITQIAIEFLLAVIILVVGNIFWEFPKRAKFLRRAISDQQFLLSFLTPDRFDSPSPAITRYAQCDGNHMASIGALAHADRVSEQRLKFITGAIVLALLVGSYFLGPIYPAIKHRRFSVLRTRAYRLCSAQERARSHFGSRLCSPQMAFGRSRRVRAMGSAGLHVEAPLYRREDRRVIA
jgi:hypothetical protein